MDLWQEVALSVTVTSAHLPLHFPFFGKCTYQARQLFMTQPRPTGNIIGKMDTISEHNIAVIDH